MPKTYAVIGVVTLYFFFIVFNLAGQLLTNLAGFIIPGYYSMEALFTASKTDDTQWLTVSPITAAVCTCFCSLLTQDLSTGLSSPFSRKLSCRPVPRSVSNHNRSVLESLLSVVYWFPFYYTFKFIFLLWLSLPMTRYAMSAPPSIVPN